MTDATAIGALGAIGALVLVGSALLARRHRGERLGRSVAIWAAIFACAFVVAMIASRSAPTG